MIYLKIQGGLGNQLYQMFFGYELAKKLNRSISFDISRLTDGWEDLDEEQKHRQLGLTLYGSIKTQFQSFGKHGWELKEDFWFFKEPRVSDSIIYNEFWNNIDSEIENLKNVDKSKPIYVDGHWQSYQFDAKQIEYFTKYLNNHEAKDSDVKYQIQTSESVCINVRRGDYITHHNGFFHECTMENYFQKVINALNENNKSLQYFIFSDDIEWCKENFKDSNMTVVDHSYAGKNFSDYLDLMRMCDIYIIPNSTFALWAAITNRKGSDRVYCPDSWYTDRDDVPNPLDNSIFKRQTNQWQRVHSTKPFTYDKFIGYDRPKLADINFNY